MAGVFPDFRHIVMPEVGHRVLEDGAEEVMRALKAIPGR
jgi:hypothetical protein